MEKQTSSICCMIRGGIISGMLNISPSASKREQEPNQSLLDTFNHRNGRTGLLVDVVDLQPDLPDQVFKLRRISLLPPQCHHHKVKLCIHERWRNCTHLLYNEKATVGCHGIGDVAENMDADFVAVVMKTAAEVVDQSA